MRRPARTAAALSVVAILLGTALLWRGRGGHDETALRDRPRTVRPPTVAGQFYPSDAKQLYDQVDRLLSAAPSAGLRGVRAILVPHAGYAFSAAVAAASFRELAPDFRRVFILAANHNGEANFSGVSLPDETHYAIPGAEVPLAAVIDELRDPGLFVHEPRAHTMHMIEVELPFLHELSRRASRPDFAIVPMIVGRLDSQAVDRLAATLDAQADGDTVFVFSVDLSHFYPDRTARQLDQYTVDTLMSRDRAALASARTDGNQVLDTMLALAARRGWEPTFLAAQNSAETTGDTSRVVGYAAIAFHEPFSLTDAEQQELLAFARSRIEEQVRHGHAPEPDAAWVDRHPLLRIPRGVFVTIEKHGRLRGCIGDLYPRKALYEGIHENAINAAIHDPRFPPVTEDELDDLSLSISVLDYPARVTVNQPDEYLRVLRPERDGVILAYDGKRSTFLPQVWRDIPDPEEFLASLARKQGAPPDAWRSPSAVLYRYAAYVFGEKSGRGAPRRDARVDGGRPRNVAGSDSRETGQWQRSISRTSWSEPHAAAAATRFPRRRSSSSRAAGIRSRSMSMRPRLGPRSSVA
jgi:AmmeMemoRadiSam system protein A/AmmeMemoRadiSam system protein B